MILDEIKVSGMDLKAEFQYYLENQQCLAHKHEGKILVIKNQQVIGIYDNEKDAMETTIPKHKLGTFLIQKCSADPDSVIWKFHSRI